MIGMHSRRKRAFAIAADRILSAAAAVLVRGREHHDRLPAHPRVLVIRCDHIGDAAMAAAGLGAVRERLGAVQLDVLTAPWAVELFERDPAVDGAPGAAGERAAGRERRAGLHGRRGVTAQSPTALPRFQRGGLP